MYNLLTEEGQCVITQQSTEKVEQENHSFTVHC